jgi:hypothetical protein
MTDSLSAWLALREPADAAARSEMVTRKIAEASTGRAPLRIVDLGSGTGSNFRYLSPRLSVPQEWLLVDRDPALLAQAPSERADVRIETRQAELGALDDSGLFDGRHLVTGSALLDLVSEAWLHRLAVRCREAGAVALFALTYNGESSCAPTEPEDEIIRHLMNRHQRQNDKGFGRAAGPDAVNGAERAFAAAGYQLRRERSDWVLLPDAREMQRRLIEGWAEAAGEVSPEQAEMIEGWLARRLAHVEAHRSRIVVGHEDLAAF